MTADSRPRGLPSADLISLVFLFICWLLIIVLVDPRGEFPSVDDWAYLASVRSLVEDGKIVFSDWSAQNLLTHLLWGALFAFPFGTSYLVLRVSTLVASLLCALALFKLMRDRGSPVSISLIAVLLLFLNPMFMALSFTFMTDISFLAAQTAAMLFLLRGLNSGSASNAAVGWSFGLAAQLCRQTGLAIPFAFAGAYLAKHGLSARRILFAVLPLLAFALLQLAYEHWLGTSGRMSLQYGKQLQSVLPTLQDPIRLAESVVRVSTYLFFYLGLFLLPLTIPVAAALLTGVPRKIAVTLGICVAAVTVLLSLASFHAGLVMPIWDDPNTLRITGIGPDVGGVAAPSLFFQAATVASLAGGVLLASCLAYAVWRSFSAPREDSTVTIVFGLLGAAALAGVLVLVEVKFDRYLLPILPWLALALGAALVMSAGPVPKWSLVVSGVLLAGLAWYSVVNVHNYMAEKRVWGDALQGLLVQGVPRETIAAGWVFNGADLYGKYGKKMVRGSWQKNKDYVVTGFGCGPRAGYEIIARYKVPRWPVFGLRGRELFVCRRFAGAGGMSVKPARRVHGFRRSRRRRGARKPARAWRQ